MYRRLPSVFSQARTEEANVFSMALFELNVLQTKCVGDYFQKKNIFQLATSQRQHTAVQPVSRQARTADDAGEDPLLEGRE